MNDVRTAVSPVNAARTFLGTDALAPSEPPVTGPAADTAVLDATVLEAPVVAGVVSPTADPSSDGSVDSVSVPEGAAVTVEPAETQP